MVKRSKILIRKIKGLEAQEEKHKLKLETEKGRKDTTPGYWQKEIIGFEKQKQILEDKLRKITGDKKIDGFNNESDKDKEQSEE